MKNAKVLEVSFEDLYYNLALEEAIFTSFLDSDFSMIVRFWSNPKSVILGRGQDLESEVDETYCLLNNIEIGRRISGGGAVYHDEGNLNISFFIKRSEVANLDNTEKLREYFTNIIAESLNDLDFPDITIQGYSNILYKEKKISGSAGYLKKTGYLHHATLLYNSNLMHLENSLLVKSLNSSDEKTSKYLPTTNLPIKNLQLLKKKILNNLETKLELKFEQGFLLNSEKILADNLTQRIYKQHSWIYDKQRE